MALTQRLDLRQSQTLVMTPQLQQAIKLLQMSNQELGDFVAQEIEQNPLLERADDTADTPALAEQIATESENSAPRESGEADPAPLSGKEVEIAPATSEEEMWASDGYAGDDAHASSRGGSFDDDEFSAVQNIAERPSLREHILGQIHVDILEPADRLIAVALAELLDEAGYLPAELDLVRAQLGAEPERFGDVVATLQRLDPPGIFARSLQECLAIQLREKNRLDPAMDILLQNLDFLARREKAALMKLCGVDAEDLTGMIEEIRQLNPKPAQTFTSDMAPPVVADVLLRPQPGGGWHVELNADNLPRVLANDRYYAKVQASARTKTDKDYLSERWQQANWLVKALHQRATTILKVSAEIVKQQDAFFIHGVQKLRPLILRDIAAAVEMHESTISRVTQNKYIATPRGLFELKYFFTTALARADGGETVSSEAVRDRIRNLIEEEKPDAILSDDRIAEILHGEGIDVARRTVAKYREALRIPTSAQRRREKKDGK
ncbi:MAG: RNA polymerase factor sigma-54 [Alphaproteobacteria bacterium]|nr:RNA polymerase factor sigma-54 [Alphaproteobacteria bacterium]